MNTLQIIPKNNDHEKFSLLNSLPFEIIERIISYFDVQSIISYEFSFFLH